MRIDDTASIPCLVLTHGHDDINRESLTSIINCDPRLEIDVVHNPSGAESGSFISFARECVGRNDIRSFTLFDENISNNAVLLFLLENLERYKANRVVISDGDIVAPKSLVQEQLSVLDAHSDVLACGLRLDASAWDDSLSIKKDLVERFNTARFEEADYVNTATGMWMTMFRGAELVAILQTIRDNRLRLTDGQIKNLGAALFQKQWVATKRSLGRELNRERPDYYDTKAVSTRGFADHSPEPPGSNYATWNHDWVVPATRWHGREQERISFPQLPRALPRFRGTLEEDPVVKGLRSGQIRYDKGYLANHLMRATRPGLAFVTCEGQCLSGLPRLPDRSALFISPQPEPGETIASLTEVDCGPVLIAREAGECRSILTTIKRFLGPGASLHGMVFNAEAARRQFAEGIPPALAHIPAGLRTFAADFGQDSRIGGSEGTIEKLVERLWSDEALGSWLNTGSGSLNLKPSLKNPHLAHFRVTI